MTISPDGHYYLLAARGIAVPVPYQRRWALPALLGPHVRRWALLTYASLALTPAAAWCYLQAHTSAPLVGAALLSALPGVWRCSLRFPVLTDAPAFALSLVVAALCSTPAWPLAIPLALLLGGTRESAPLFAALWAWSPVPLVGLLAVGWTHRSAPAAEPWLTRPIATALELRRRMGPDGMLYVAPWGAALLGFAGLDWRGWLTVAVAYAQLLTAQDTIRLYTWAAPVVVAAAAEQVPLAWLPVALAVTALQSWEERV